MTRIGIVGSGSIGGTLCRLLDRAGHPVLLANERGPNSMVAFLAGARRSRAGTVREAVAFGDVVVLALPYGRVRDLPADAFRGKVVVDATNHRPDRDGPVPGLDPELTTQSELVGAHLAGARLVKAFNTLPRRPLDECGRPGAPWEHRLVLFLAGDDPAAKRAVACLVDAVGFAPVDTGSLADGGRRQQPGSPLFGARLRPAQVELPEPQPA